MNQADKAKLFAKLHVKGSPVILYNAWDVGSAKTIVEAGAQAIARRRGFADVIRRTNCGADLSFG
jgi:2-methylisocitrate lyase-like PEP mutase family enzyme